MLYSVALCAQVSSYCVVVVLVLKISRVEEEEEEEESGPCGTKPLWERAARTGRL